MMDLHFRATGGTSTECPIVPHVHVHMHTDTCTWTSAHIHVKYDTMLAVKATE